MTDTPAATLKRAAAKLRDLVTAVETGIATNPYWTSEHPGVGVALADWLDAEAAIWDAIETVKTEYGPKGLKVTMPVSTHDEALAVARALLAEGVQR